MNTAQIKQMLINLAAGATRESQGLIKDSINGRWYLPAQEASYSGPLFVVKESDGAFTLCRSRENGNGYMELSRAHPDGTYSESKWVFNPYTRSNEFRIVEE